MNAPADARARAIAAIDAANAHDPTTITAGDRTGPKEVVHAELATAWVQRLAPDADDALLLAARGHHLRRWTTPRASYPAGRAGYLRWRKAMHDQHAAELGTLLTAAGYDDAFVGRVQALVRKDGLGRPDADPAVQVLEDALCLVFLETQLDDVALRLEPATLRRVLIKSLHKMSPAGRTRVGEISLAPGAQHILAEAVACDTVTRYLDALPRADAVELAATLAPEVERIGPYNDVYRGRDAYARFLAETVGALGGYSLAVDRMIVDGSAVAVELSETVDDGDARLRTEEVVTFDVADGLITKIAVFLRASERSSPGG